MYVPRAVVAISHCISLFSVLHKLRTEDRGFFIHDFTDQSDAFHKDLGDMLYTLEPPVVIQVVENQEIHFDTHRLNQIENGVLTEHPYALVQVVTPKENSSVSDYHYFVVTRGDMTPERFRDLKTEQDRHRGIQWIGDDNQVSWVDD